MTDAAGSGQDLVAALQAPFRDDQIGKLPRVTCPACSKGRDCSDHNRRWCDTCRNMISERHIHIDFVGHADVTERLIAVDPHWSWAPAYKDVDLHVLASACASGVPEIVQMVIDNAPPKFDLDERGNPVGLWITLTVLGDSIPGYASVPSGQHDAVKVLIGDGLRNAAMRRGVALSLWAKGDRADPGRENATASAGQARRSNGHQTRSERPVSRSLPSAPDETDWEWATEWQDRVAAATTLEQLRELGGKVSTSGKVAEADRARLRQIYIERQAELGGATNPEGPAANETDSSVSIAELEKEIAEAATVEVLDVIRAAIRAAFKDGAFGPSEANALIDLVQQRGTELGAELNGAGVSA